MRATRIEVFSPCGYLDWWGTTHMGIVADELCAMAKVAMDEVAVVAPPWHGPRRP